MNGNRCATLAARYFTALDRRDPEALSALLAPACRLSIETHGIFHDGRDAILALFTARWQAAWPKVQHRLIGALADPDAGRIATQIAVVYTHEDGRIETRSNANFFDIEGDRFTAVRVYMAGENTIRA